MLALILYLIFPFCCILAIRPSQARCRGSVAERVVYGIALYEFLLLSIGLCLGSTGLLVKTSYTVVTFSMTIFLGVRSWRNGFSVDVTALFQCAKTKRGLATLLMVFLIAMVYVTQLGIDAFFGTKHIDGLWYHIPRIIFWLQQGNFDAWPTPVWSQIGLPLGADIVLGQKILLGSGWLGIGYVTFVLTVGAIASVYVVALDIGFSRWNAALSALLFSSFPVIGLRIWSVNSDITAAFPVLASYVVLHRVRNPNIGIAVFIVLNGVALACKQTVIFHAALLACVAFWQCRQKLVKIESYYLVIVACILSASIVTFSFLPVYRAFGDLDGGPGGRGHKVTSVTEFNHSVAMSSSHWLLEPLGYLTPLPEYENRVKGVAKSVYNSVGANFDVLPEMWKPWPAQDIGRSGLVSVLFLPLLLFGLPPKARIASAALFLLGFIPLSGILHPSPYFARYTIVLLAGFALLWGGTKYFQHGNKRWLLIGVVALNIFSLSGVVLMRFYVDKTVKSRPGGPYYYLSDEDRSIIARSLQGRPLQVITSDSLDAFLPGPDISFKLKYIIAPDDGDWGNEMRKAGTVSNWLAVVHGGEKSIPLAADPHVPTMEFPKGVSVRELEGALEGAGWQRYKSYPLVDLWSSMDIIQGKIE